jgi:hypothetical protein
MGQQGLAAQAAGGEGNDDCGGLHEAPAWPEPGVHRVLAAGSVPHQQAQKLAAPLDDTHLGDTAHDRPAVSRGDPLTVATDQSAAPGLLAEVGIAAAQLALQQLGETPRPTRAHERV